MKGLYGNRDQKDSLEALVKLTRVLPLIFWSQDSGKFFLTYHFVLLVAFHLLQDMSNCEENGKG